MFQTMTQIVKKLYRLVYFILLKWSYRKLTFKTLIYPSARIEGKKYISLGKGSTIQRYGWLLALKTGEVEPILKIGDGCAIGDVCHIASIRSVIIEDQVLMANKVYISDNVHEFEDITKPVIDQPVKFKGDVRIGTGSWIGENVCIIGASVGKNSVIGANAVVTQDIPDYAIAVGSPAKVIKTYDHSQKAWVKVN